MYTEGRKKIDKLKIMINSDGRGYSESIYMLRFPLAILVVFVHGFGAEINITELHAGGLTGLAVYDYIRLFFSVVISRSAVPVFFIISGYLLFLKVEKYDKAIYISKLRKRLHGLVIPYVSWILLFVLWILMFKLGGILLYDKPWMGIVDYFKENGYLHMFWDSSVWGERETWLGVKAHNSGPVLLPFWYMRDLIMMVIFSPVCYWLIKNIKLVFIAFLFTIYVLDIRISYMSESFVDASLFFSLGAYFAIMKQDFTDVLWKWRYAIVPLAVILMAMQTYTGSAMGDRVSRMIHPWLVIFQSAALIIVASAMCRHQGLYRWNKKLAGTSFFIYALHPFILGYVIAFINKVAPMGNAWYMQTFCYLTAPLACVMVCIGVYWGMRMYMPSVMRVLMGERNDVNKQRKNPNP